MNFENLGVEECIKQFGTPLRLQFEACIASNIEDATRIFEKKILELGYCGTYNYAYSIKANAYAEAMVCALKHCKTIECSSENELKVIEFLVDKRFLDEKNTILINGFKGDAHVLQANKFAKFANVIFVLDNIEEFDLVKNLDEKVQIGFRSASDSASKFGMSGEDAAKIAKKLKNSPHKLTTMHFHIHSSQSEEQILNLVEQKLGLFVKIKAANPNLANLDLGGFSAISKQISRENFADELLSLLMKFCSERGLQQPNIFQEFGGDAVSNSECLIYQVEKVKKTEKAIWYVLDGSIMSDFPDRWAGIVPNLKIQFLGDFKKPNLLCNLAGCTCDDDDAIRDVMCPTLKSGKKMYVAIEDTGAYQEMLQSKGVRHDLCEDTKKVFVRHDGEKMLFEEQCTDLLKSLHYDEKTTNFLSK